MGVGSAKPRRAIASSTPGPSLIPSQAAMSTAGAPGVAGMGLDFASAVAASVFAFFFLGAPGSSAVGQAKHQHDMAAFAAIRVVTDDK